MHLLIIHKLCTLIGRGHFHIQDGCRVVEDFAGEPFCFVSAIDGEENASVSGGHPLSSERLAADSADR